jgi:quinone-modifying oxidoreductase, subunit QmoC
MTQAIPIQPDTAFLRRVMAAGGGDLKKCYQCATCSVACELSDEEVSFPRRQMLAAQWGLKDRLMADPAIWLCHHCGKCSDLCPRGARPGDVMGALRSEAIRHFAFPQALGRLAGNPKALPLLFLLPALILTAIMLWAPKQAPVPEMEFADLFPIPIMEALFFAVSGIALIAFVTALRRFGRALRDAGETVGGYLRPTLVEIGNHQRFGLCEDSGMRLGHLLTFWGFMGLGVVGTLAGVGSMTGLLRTPLSLIHPIKVFANLMAATSLVGVVLLMLDRLRGKTTRSRGAYFDWFFLGTLAGVLLTGIVSQILRLAQTGAMYPVYFVHLVLVLGLMLYAPYSKFAHLAYRTMALASSANSHRRG